MLPNLPRRLKAPVCPFRFVAAFLRNQAPHLDVAGQAKAAADCAKLDQAAAVGGFMSDDPVLLFLIGNSAINADHRQALIDLVASDDAVKTLWRLNGWQG